VRGRDSVYRQRELLFDNKKISKYRPGTRQR
jgi:hypothetical protein